MKGKKKEMQVEMEAKLLENQREVSCQEECGTELMLRKAEEKKGEEDLMQLADFEVKKRKEGKRGCWRINEK
ncbi:hypothetical protein NPIL_166761, partial [Nephila pilipes]